MVFYAVLVKSALRSDLFSSDVSACMDQSGRCCCWHNCVSGPYKPKELKLPLVMSLVIKTANVLEITRKAFNGHRAKVNLCGI